MQVGQYMDVVLHAVDPIQNTIPVSYYTPDIFVQLLVMCLGNSVFPIISAKYDVIQNLPVTVHVDVILVNP